MDSKDSKDEETLGDLPDKDEETLNGILDIILEVFDEHKVSAEDGAMLSMNLLLSSIEFMGTLNAEEFADILGQLTKITMPHGHSIPNVVRPRKGSYYFIGSDRGWGLDSSLLDEEN